MSDDWRDIVRMLHETARHPYMDNTCKMNVFDAAKAADEIERLRAEVEKLRAALKPFADEAEYVSTGASDADWYELDAMKVGHFRAAAAALKGNS